MPSWIRLQAKPTSTREAVLPVSHLWGTIKYLMGLCKKPLIQHSSPSQWGRGIENQELIPGSSLNYTLRSPEGILFLSFHTEVAEAAISLSPPFKKALLCSQEPTLIAELNLSTISHFSCGKTFKNSNDTDSSD